MSSFPWSVPAGLVRAVAGVALATFVVAACNSGVTPPSGVAAGSAAAGGAASPAASGTSSFDTSAAESYCTDQGGMLVSRTPTWNTNADQSAWLTLGPAQTFCEFQSGEGDSATRISVDLVTLYSETPTLAGVAYLSKVPPTPSTNGSNPATANCTALGGTSAFGNTAAGGGWVNTSEPTFVVMNECVFADMSAIDEWGITYYADGTVRGADLATKMRYQPDGQLPAMYAGGR